MLTHILTLPSVLQSNVWCYMDNLPSGQQGHYPTSHGKCTQGVSVSNLSYHAGAAGTCCPIVPSTRPHNASYTLHAYAARDSKGRRPLPRTCRQAPIPPLLRQQSTKAAPEPRMCVLPHVLILTTSHIQRSQRHVGDTSQRGREGGILLQSTETARGEHPYHALAGKHRLRRCFVSRAPNTA